jgi:glucosylceramidase
MLQGGGSIVVAGNERFPGVGHQSVYEFDGKDYLFFHGYDRQDAGKSKLLIHEIAWDSEGWPTVLLNETKTSAETSTQSCTWISSAEGAEWQQTEVKTQNRAEATPLLEVTGNEQPIAIFRNWGTCFNELGWDALNMLPQTQQETILKQLFSPDGDLQFTVGRIPMNANDYARDWYSCDEVSGDFQLEYFNINRDKTTLIPYIKAAQHYNPDMTFWISPWSPPSWMKINHYYSVRNDSKVNQMPPKSDIALFEGNAVKDDRVFPRQLAVNDYLIQDERYLKTYADYFGKFISAYGEQGIPISMVMFQNEAWSYTNYPGCAWTADGIIRFNTEYLAPALKTQHPDVEIYLGTINTNRYDEIDKILSAARMPETIKGVGLQWEGGQILPRLRAKYPQYKYVQTESECGWGSFDWKAAEHTFERINHYLGNGCEDYTFWNAILYDNGASGWGWKQNALIRVDSQKGTAIHTPEYYAVKHYSHFISAGSRLVAFRPAEDKIPVLVFLTPGNKPVVVAGNFNDEAKPLSIKIAGNFLNITLKAHSLNTFQMI